MATDDPVSSSFESRVDEVALQSPALLKPALERGADYAEVFFQQRSATGLRTSVHAGTTAPRILVSEHLEEGLSIGALDTAQQEMQAVAGWVPGAWQDASLNVARKFARQKASPLDSHNIDVRIDWLEHMPQDAPCMASVAEKKHLLSTIAEQVFSYAPEVAQCTIDYRDLSNKSLLLNSEGSAQARASSTFGLRLMVDVGAKSDNKKKRAAYTTLGFRGRFGALAFGLSPYIIEQLVERAHRMKDAREIATGHMPVVFAGGSAGLWLHELVGHLLEADVLPDTLSIGDSLSGAGLTVYDDATLSEQMGTYASDDQGIKGQRTRLIEKGRIANVLTDRFYAAQLQQPFTGNGRRASFTDPPLPRMSNLSMAAGDQAPEDIIRSVRHGLYVQQARAGVHDKGSREFQLHVAEGYLIKEGRLDQPVCDVLISGNGLTALRQLVAIGNDVSLDQGMGQCKKAGQVVPVSVSTPTVRIDGLQVQQVT